MSSITSFGLARTGPASTAAAGTAAANVSSTVSGLQKFRRKRWFMCALYGCRIGIAFGMRTPTRRLIHHSRSTGRPACATQRAKLRATASSMSPVEACPPCFRSWTSSRSRPLRPKTGGSPNRSRTAGMVVPSHGTRVTAVGSALPSGSAGPLAEVGAANVLRSI